MKPKYIKPKDDGQMLIDMQNLILKDTNAGLISITIHYACRQFIKDLKKVPLSEELQLI